MKRIALLAALAILAAPVFADEPDPATLYDLTSSGTTAKLKAGQKGTFVLAITPKSGAHISDEAPLKIELTGKNVTLDKAKLTREDALPKNVEGQAQPPRFEVPFVGSTAGQGTIDVKATFFICTDKICSRQQKNLSVPVTVE